jgi:O-antigen/teichoic acid export membrane protein
MGDVRRSAVRGLAWTTASYGLREAVLFGTGILVARLLLPEELGVFALAALALAILGLVRSLGLSAAVVRDPDLTPERQSAAFWLSALLGVLLTLGLFAAAGPAARWLDEPALAPALRWLAPAFFLESLGATHDALLERRRDYRRRAVRDGAATLLGAALAVALVLAGAGILALIAQRLAASALSTAFLWLAVDWRPRLVARLRDVRALLAFGLPLAGSTALTWLAGNLDRLLVGRFLGAAALGAYALAYTIARGPGALVQAVLGGILFPELSHLRDDVARVRSVYLQSLAHVTAALLLPLSILCSLAPAFVHAVYGPQWSAAGPVVSLFAVVAAVPIVTTTATWLLASQGRSAHLLLASAVSCALVAAGFAVGLRWGLVGLAAAYAVATLAHGVPFAIFAFRSVGLPLKTAAKGLLGPLLAWAESTSVGTIFQAAWPGTGSWGLLAAGGSACALSYLLVLWIVDRPLLHSLKRIPEELRGRKPAAEPASVGRS